MKELNDFVKGEIAAYSYMVRLGKPATIIPIKTVQVDAAVRYVKKSYNLRTYTEDLTDGWTTLWIYKDKYLLEVIKSLPQKPKTAFEHWALGKVFGYSEEAIKEYVKKHCNVI